MALPSLCYTVPFFFFNDTATTEIYTLSLHDALPISRPDGVLEPRERRLRSQGRPGEGIALEQELVDRIVGQPGSVVAVGVAAGEAKEPLPRSEEHTSELQSLAYLVCRLLLEKKKKHSC